MSRLRRNLWRAYLALGGIGCTAYLIGPLRGSAPLMNALGLSPVVAILAGVVRHRPQARSAWLLLAAGSAFFWLGDLYNYGYPLLMHAEVPFPSPGDGSYLAMYPVMMAGLLLLVRRRASRSKDRGGLVDSLNPDRRAGAAVLGRADRPVPASE